MHTLVRISAALTCVGFPSRFDYSWLGTRTRLGARAWLFTDRFGDEVSSWLRAWDSGSAHHGSAPGSRPDSSHFGIDSAVGSALDVARYSTRLGSRLHSRLDSVQIIGARGSARLRSSGLEARLGSDRGAIRLGSAWYPAPGLGMVDSRLGSAQASDRHRLGWRVGSGLDSVLSETRAGISSRKSARCSTRDITGLGFGPGSASGLRIGSALFKDWLGSKRGSAR